MVRVERKLPRPSLAVVEKSCRTMIPEITAFALRRLFTAPKIGKFRSRAVIAAPWHLGTVRAYVSSTEYGKAPLLFNANTAHTSTVTYYDPY